ncbi:MAG: FG-GAP repeat domain-containing protein, partial [Thermoanaerobaculia bacterium]
APATVADPELICNAVEKNRVPIFDPGAHLKFYRITSPLQNVVSANVVVVRNQFGTQTFTLGDRVELAVPTQKNTLSPPLALDHYTCYEVTGNDLNVPVSLSDQFHTSNTVVVQPSRLCNPAAKVHNGQLTTVQDPRWHLVCYTIQPSTFSPISVTTSNQFGSETITARQPWSLCVPSQKFFEGFEPRVPHTVALVDPAQGLWYLRDLAGQETSFFFGNPDDVPFMGDWDCDGDETPGLYRQSDGFVYLRNSNSQGIADIEYFFGNPDDVPLAGDFDNDGCDTVSIYRPSEQRVYVINELGEDGGGVGPADFFFTFGNPGDSPVVGDWDGDGIDEVGLHRQSTGFFYWRDTLTTGIADADIFFGDPDDRFVAGDWGIVDGKDTPAVFRPSDTTFYFRHTLTQGVADSQFASGQAPWLPVGGIFGLD